MSELNEDDVAHYALAESRLEDLQHYLARGQQFQALSDAALGAKFVEAMREWASSPTDVARRQMVFDVLAEYDLRKTEPPWKAAAADFEIIKAAAKRAAQGMTEEQRLEQGVRMIEHYMQARGKQH